MTSIVFTNGCFDLLHRAHIELLEFCKKQGDQVVVGLNSDESVRRLKGDKRPINSAIDRSYVLEALHCVDKVIIFDEDTPYELIKMISPDIIVKGGDYRPEEVVGNEFCKVLIFDYVCGYSTTKTIQSVTNR